MQSTSQDFNVFKIGTPINMGLIFVYLIITHTPTSHNQNLKHNSIYGHSES